MFLSGYRMGESYHNSAMVAPLAQLLHCAAPAKHRLYGSLRGFDQIHLWAYGSGTGAALPPKYQTTCNQVLRLCRLSTGHVNRWDKSTSIHAPAPTTCIDIEC